MSRLLTDEELDNIGYPLLPLGDRTGYYRVAKAQRDLSDRETLKAVGEWLGNELTKSPMGCRLCLKELKDVLLRGEMLGEDPIHAACRED